jgi:hypothetical protein
MKTEIPGQDFVTLHTGGEAATADTQDRQGIAPKRIISDGRWGNTTCS